jgi:hypothetical protein
MAALPGGQRSLHRQPREARTELPRDAIILRWEALRELGISLGDTVNVRCTGEASAKTQSMLAWASGRVPAGIALVPPMSDHLNCTGHLELWPADLSPEGEPLTRTSASVPIAARLAHSSSARVHMARAHMARRLSGFSSNNDVSTESAGPCPLLPLPTGEADMAIGLELETLAQVRSVAPALRISPTALASPFRLTSAHQRARRMLGGCVQEGQQAASVSRSVRRLKKKAL